MKIDDYIDTYKSYANDYEKGRYEMGWSSQQRDYAIGRAREYKQLAEWLEELKAIKKGAVFYSNRPIEDIVLEARNDAIDEFIDKFIKRNQFKQMNKCECINAMYVLAEQLKEQKNG